MQEISTEIEPLMQENLTDNQPVTSEIVPGGTIRRKPQLHSSNRNAYTIRKETFTEN